MDSSPRRAIALIAAYAVALQGLLLAFGPASPMTLAVPFAALCTADQGNAAGHGQPERHDWPCAAVCAALGHGIAGPVPPGVTVAFAVVQNSAVAAPANAWVPPHRFRSGPQIPRGPPLA